MGCFLGSRELQRTVHTSCEFGLRYKDPSFVLSIWERNSNPLTTHKASCTSSHRLRNAIACLKSRLLSELALNASVIWIYWTYSDVTWGELRFEVDIRELGRPFYKAAIFRLRLLADSTNSWDDLLWLSIPTNSKWAWVTKSKQDVRSMLWKLNGLNTQIIEVETRWI